jgi:glycogen debranching enzyme
LVKLLSKEGYVIKKKTIYNFKYNKISMLETCYEKAIETLKTCSTKHGFFASGGEDGYDAIWARDSMISSLGASLLPEFKTVIKNSIINLKNHQSKNGQIPNAIDNYSERKPHTDFKTIDSTLWYVIGHYIYKKNYKDNSLMKKHKLSIEKAITWLRYQDPGETGMISQLPTSDWQDAFPHKYGYTINTHALYYQVLNLVGKKSEASNIKHLVNKDDDDKKLWKEDFYVPYRWKNHNKYHEIGTWFDSLGNILAILFDLAEKPQALKILNYIEKKRINKPYPLKSIYPPIKPGDKEWKDYFYDSGAGRQYYYANGGAWGFIGCFYVLALIKQKQFEKAEKELKKIAEKNIKGNFPEWTSPITKKPFGKLQAWEAGMFILAYRSLIEKKVLLNI